MRREREGDDRRTERDRQMGEWTGRQRQIDGWTDTQTERWTERQIMKKQIQMREM